MFICLLCSFIAAAFAFNIASGHYSDSRNPVVGTSVCVNSADSQVFTLATVFTQGRDRHIDIDTATDNTVNINDVKIVEQKSTEVVPPDNCLIHEVTESSGSFQAGMLTPVSIHIHHFVVPFCALH